MSNLNYLTDSEAESTRILNLKIKKFRCMKCGKEFLTDRCHRICSRCKKVNRGNNGYDRQRYKVIGADDEVCSLCRDFELLDEQDI